MATLATDNFDRANNADVGANGMPLTDEGHVGVSSKAGKRQILWPILLIILLFGITVPAHAAWYVAPASSGGSDSNPGTRTQPFLTFERAKTAMAGSADKQTYLRQGTYLRTTPYTFGSNENWATDPLDPARSAIIDFSTMTNPPYGMRCNGCSNLSIRNVTFNKGPNYPTDVYNATNILVEGGANNIFIENNLFTGALNWHSQAGLAAYHILLFDANVIYVRGNSFVAAPQRGGEPIYWTTGQTGNWHDLYITDNTFDGCARWCVEVQPQVNSSTIDHWHIDRNVFVRYEGAQGLCEGVGNPAGAISAASNINGSNYVTNSTIWGNTFTAVTNNNNCAQSIEMLWDGVTVSQNTFSWPGKGLVVGSSGGTVIENNTFSLTTSGSLNPDCGGGRACAFDDSTGNYNGTEWIGVNTINGSSVTGCQSPFCAFAPKSYGTKPTVWAPSAPFGNTTAPAAPANLRVVSP